MKKTIAVILAAIMMISLSSCAVIRVIPRDLRVYEKPEQMETNPYYHVWVRPQGHVEYTELPCYESATPFVTFDYDFEVPIEVKIEYGASSFMERAYILPTSAEIETQVDNKTVTFWMDKPEKISVEFSLRRSINLFVFANAIEDEAQVPDPDTQDPNILYYGPGYHEVGHLELKSNQTLYLAGGAVLDAYITATDAENVKILGRGIITGKNYSYSPDRYQIITLIRCTNVYVEGITLMDSNAWTFVTKYCKDVTITDIKEVCDGLNSDGFDICSSENVLIDNVFVRNHDDNISIKAFNGIPSKNITMQNSVLFTTAAHNMLVGPEAKPGADGESIVFDQITFKNIDVIRNETQSGTFCGVMAIMACDNSITQNVTWENIRIDRSIAPMIHFSYTNAYSNIGIGKKVQNITVKNVQTCAESRTAWIFGEDEEHTIDNVKLYDLYNGDQKLTIESGFIQTEFADVEEFFTDSQS